jgi:hypothetical protein
LARWLVASRPRCKPPTGGRENSITLSFNGPRIDEATPDLRSWGWHFWWPNGAKAGETILFNIYCIKT